MLNSRVSAACVVAAVIVATASSVFAQGRNQLPKERFSSAGKLKAMRPGLMHIENTGGDEWYVRVEAPPKDVILTGTAVPDWIRSGVLVQFTAPFNKKGIAQEKIVEIKVSSPREGMRVGVVEQATGGSTSAGRNLGAFTNQGAEGGDAEQQPETEEAAWYQVTGMLQTIKAGKMTVIAGGATVRAELDGEAKISVDISDYRFARVGDMVEFDGWYYPGQQKFVHATKLSIKAAKPLGGEEKPEKKVVSTDKSEPESKKKKKKRRDPLALP